MNIKKHKILKALYIKWEQGEARTGNGLEVTDLGKSLTTTEIQKETKLQISDIEQICFVLTNTNYIKLFNKNQNDKVNRYLIIDSGQTAFLEKYFLNKVWYRNFDFWKFFLPFLIGLLGLLNSIFQWFTITSN